MKSDTLYCLCNKNKWFTGGDISQYDTLFDRAKEGASIDELTIIIWICSDRAIHTKESIKQELLKHWED